MYPVVITLTNLNIYIMNRKEFLSSIMNLAWQFVKDNNLSLSPALKQSWLNAKLKNEMKKRRVKFEYKKLDGSTRIACGTLNINEISSKYIYKNKKHNDETTQTYYDLEKGCFRCFKKINLVKAQIKFLNSDYLYGEL